MLDAKKAIKHLMLERNMKVGETAKSLDTDPRIFSNWLYRPDSPKISKVEPILQLFGCHLAIVDDETGEILF